MAVPITLRVFQGDLEVAAKDFDRDMIKIGRLSSAHLSLSDEKVSRIHSVIDVSPEGVLSITDMGSIEGTYVNDKRVTKSELNFGDSIRVGGSVIKVEKPGAVAPAVVAVPMGTAVNDGPTQINAVIPDAAVLSAGPTMTVPMFRAVQVPEAAVTAPAVARVPPPPAAEVLDEHSGAVTRARPGRRHGTGPLGVELRFMWGDSIVATHYIGPTTTKAFTVGSASDVDFAMGDSKLGNPKFAVVRTEPKGSSTNATVRFTKSMKGELHRKNGQEVLTLAEVIERKLAQNDGDAYSLPLDEDDFAWVDLGNVVLEIAYQPQAKPVIVPWAETVDFTALNTFLVVMFLGAIFVITAINSALEGDELADELNSNQARIVKLLVKPPEAQVAKLLNKEKKDSGEIAQKHKGDDGQMGKKDAPKKSAHAAPKGDPNNKDQARLLVAKVFGGGGGLSTVFGHQGLGGELRSAMGNMFGAAPGDAQGFGGLGLRGSGSGGGGVGDTIGIGGIGTKGRGGGTGGYGSGAGTLGGKGSADIGIASSEPVVNGSLDKELIRQVIRRNINQIKFCYENQLQKHPKLNGKVSVRFIITGEGTVSQSSVANADTNNAELETCVAGRVRTWLFPKPKGGGMVAVTYPFVFKKSGE